MEAKSAEKLCFTCKETGPYRTTSRNQLLTKRVEEGAVAKKYLGPILAWSAGQKKAVSVFYKRDEEHFFRWPQF